MGDRQPRIEYVPALDGLRALGALLVMAFHARAPWASGGFLGVDLFFVLSGYLIVRLLVAEHRATGCIDVRRFYLRRLRRLYPALVALSIVYLAVSPIAFRGVTNHVRDALLSAVFLSDYSRAWWTVPVVLGHTWSIAAEARFYFLCAPALLLLFRVPVGRRLLIFGGLFLVCLAWRWSGGGDGWGGAAWLQAYYRFDLRLPGFLLGGALGWLNLRSPGWLGVLGLLAIGLSVTSTHWGDSAAYTLHAPFVELGTAAAVTASGRLGFLGTALLRWLGQRSYGIYLWHYPIFFWMRYVAELPWEVTLLAGGAAAIALADLSFRFVESAWLPTSATAAWRGREGRHGTQAAEGSLG